MRIALVLALAASAAAQSICDGNGLGSAFVRATYAPFGGTLTVDFGSPAAPSGIGAVAISTGFGPMVAPPPIGLVCIDFTSPLYTALFFGFDPAGSARWQWSIPADVGLFGFGPLFVHGVALEGSLANPVLSVSRTARVDLELRDTHRRVVGMQIGRSLHTATSLQVAPNDPRTEVLICGGDGGNFMQPVATATTDLFDPLRREFRSGPPMTQARGGHQATLLYDGRVLVCGGVDTGGVTLASAEVYDPATNTFTAVASMSAPRTAHRATRLLDGRVLVTGGFADWTQATTQFVPRLNTVQDTAEIFDPTTGTWANAGVMGSKRGGHVQVLWPDGRVLVASGVNGGVTTNFGWGVGNVPTFTATGDWFVPGQDSFVPGPLGLAAAFSGASFLPNGDLLVAGGLWSGGSNGAAVASRYVQRFDGTTWTQLAQLPGLGGAGMPGQVTLASGEVLVAGGVVSDLTQLSGTSECTVWDGATWGAVAPIGTHPVIGGAAVARFAHTATLLPDGAVLLVGGSHLLTAADEAWVYYR
jgi:hypothetical protein